MKTYATLKKHGKQPLSTQQLYTEVNTEYEKLLSPSQKRLNKLIMLVKLWF